MTSSSPDPREVPPQEEEDETKTFPIDDEDAEDEEADAIGTDEADSLNSDSQEMAKETEQMAPMLAAALPNIQAMAQMIAACSPRFNVGQSPSYMFMQPLMNPFLAATAALSPAFGGTIGSPVYGYPQMGMQPPMIPFGHYPHHQMPQMQRNPLSHSAQNTPRRQARRNEERIKKPLNSFMLYMKCNRKKMLEEKDEYRKMQSAELNKVMGENWQKLTTEEREVYEKMAKQEQENHKQKYPNWTARDNYAVHKRRQRRDRVEDSGNESKKCRARFGIDNQDEWCKHCKRKKRCLNVYKREDISPLVSSTTHHEGIMNINAMNLHRQPTESPLSSRSGTTATGSLSHPGSIKSEMNDDSDEDDAMSEGEAETTLTEPSALSQPPPATSQSGAPLPHPQPQIAHPIPQLPTAFPGGHMGFGFPAFGNMFPYPPMHPPPQPQATSEAPEYKNL